MPSNPKNEQSKRITPQSFNTEYNKDDIKLYTLTNNNGLVCQITNFGAGVVSILTPDTNGVIKDIVVGYGTAKDFVEKETFYFGATIGRHGNRIANAQFELDGITYNLEANNGQNALHGGIKGFNRKIWKVDKLESNLISLNYLSPDNEEGFPGNLNINVVYELTNDNELKIQYFAKTDKKTIVNLTNHTYFNLKGQGSGNINNHILHINAESFTPVDDQLIPIGEIVTVKGTPFDFTSPKTIEKDLYSDDMQIKYGNGYDHNWVINGSEKVNFAAKILDPISGRVMEVHTNEPGIQFYGGNFIDSKAGKTGNNYGPRSGFCLETQHFPDSPNKPQFPTTQLNVGETYYSICVYKFSVSK